MEGVASFAPAAPQDLPALLEADSRTLQEPGRAQRLRQWVEEGACTVALVDRRIVGYAVLSHHFYGNGFVEMLWVHPSWRRRGLGRALMQRLRRYCTTDRLFTSTNLSNLPMQGLLAALGYRLAGVIQYLDPGDPELVYVHTGEGPGR